jgi:hypothetical protein
MKVPCSINDGKQCNEPFCKYIWFLMQAEYAKRDWMTAISTEIERLKKK